jgi:phospho-N-acetylmuramoyl-pentapeptide-transferase
LLMACLGWQDDALKFSKHHNKGWGGYKKLLIQGITGLALGILLMLAGHNGNIQTYWGVISLSYGYPLFAAVVMMATTNAVNITDGLDGLAASTCLITFLALAVWLMATPKEIFPLDMGLTLICIVTAGVCAGFLLFNWHPAKVFMGDTGSMGLGGLLAAVALSARLDVLLVGFAALFVIEVLSVILQVTSVKLRQGKRLFKMAPLHHHFELCGLSEVMVVLLFTGVQTLACMLALGPLLWDDKPVRVPQQVMPLEETQQREDTTQKQSPQAPMPSTRP